MSASSLAQAASGQPGLASGRSATPGTPRAGQPGLETWRTPLESPVAHDDGHLPQALPIGSSVAQGPSPEPAETSKETTMAKYKLSGNQTFAATRVRTFPDRHNRLDQEGLRVFSREHPMPLPAVDPDPTGGRNGYIADAVADRKILPALRRPRA